MPINKIISDLSLMLVALSNLTQESILVLPDKNSLVICVLEDGLSVAGVQDFRKMQLTSCELPDRFRTFKAKMTTTTDCLFSINIGKRPKTRHYAQNESRGPP